MKLDLIDFDEFTLAHPDENGLCTTDSFMVRTTVGERLPILCGENTGQHSKYTINNLMIVLRLVRQMLTNIIQLIVFLVLVYIDMGRGSANPVVLSVVSNGEKVTRKWKIRISMISCNNLDMGKSNEIILSNGGSFYQ